MKNKRLEIPSDKLPIDSEQLKNPNNEEETFKQLARDIARRGFQFFDNDKENDEIQKAAKDYIEVEEEPPKNTLKNNLNKEKLETQLKDFFGEKYSLLLKYYSQKMTAALIGKSFLDRSIGDIGGNSFVFVIDNNPIIRKQKNDIHFEFKIKLNILYIGGDAPEKTSIANADIHARLEKNGFLRTSITTDSIRFYEIANNLTYHLSPLNKNRFKSLLESNPQRPSSIKKSTDKEMLNLFKELLTIHTEFRELKDELAKLELDKKVSKALNTIDKKINAIKDSSAIDRDINCLYEILDYVNKLSHSLANDSSAISDRCDRLSQKCCDYIKRIQILKRKDELKQIKQKITNIDNQLENFITSNSNTPNPRNNRRVAYAKFMRHIIQKYNARNYDGNNLAALSDSVNLLNTLKDIYLEAEKPKTFYEKLLSILPSFMVIPFSWQKDFNVLKNLPYRKASSPVFSKALANEIIQLEKNFKQPTNIYLRIKNFFNNKKQHLAFRAKRSEIDNITDNLKKKIDENLKKSSSSSAVESTEQNNHSNPQMISSRISNLSKELSSIRIQSQNQELTTADFKKKISKVPLIKLSSLIKKLRNDLIELKANRYNKITHGHAIRTKINKDLMAVSEHYETNKANEIKTAISQAIGKLYATDNASKIRDAIMTLIYKTLPALDDDFKVAKEISCIDYLVDKTIKCFIENKHFALSDNRYGLHSESKNNPEGIPQLKEKSEKSQMKNEM